MTEPGTVRFGVTTITKATTVLIGLAGVVLAIAALIHNPWQVIPALGFLGAFGSVAYAALRVGVEATPEGLRTNRGFRSQRLDWDAVEGFWIREARYQGGVCVLTAPNGLLMLPLAQSIWPARPNQQEALAMRDALETFWNRVRPGHPTIDVDRAGEERIATWRAVTARASEQTLLARVGRPVLAAVYGVIMIVIGVRTLTAGESLVALLLIGVGLVPIGLALRQLRRQGGFGGPRASGGGIDSRG